jgi:hypothetical protein
MIRSLSEARQAALDEPKRWRACVYEATGTPVTERDDTQVHLFCHVKTAQEKLRERIAELQAAGYARDKRFKLGSGLVKLDSGGGSVWLAIDKRTA